jgi:hypothetical protein
VSPIYIASNSKWPAKAWFDYLNLRLNCIQFHKDLMLGELSYSDGRIQNVQKKLRYISDANYFIQDHQDLEWKQGLLLLFRGLTGMSMLGNYAVQNFPEKIIDIENTKKHSSQFLQHKLHTKTELIFKEYSWTNSCKQQSKRHKKD